MVPIILAYVAAGVVAYGGYRARALSASGAVAACVVGGTVLGFGGLARAILLVLFFASSSALSFLKSSDARKRKAAEMFEKGGRRDAAQVLANGGVPALLALLSGFAAAPLVPLLFGAYTGTLAAATADTWATEIGVLSNHQPFMITSGERVPAGTSGAVTLLGSSASVAGAFFLGLAGGTLTAWALPMVAGAPIAVLGAGLAGGIAGSLVDSLLGATLQAAYLCPQCGKPTESAIHRCGTQTLLVRGLPLLDNDLVNLLATTTGAVVGGTAGWLMGLG